MTTENNNNTIETKEEKNLHVDTNKSELTGLLDQLNEKIQTGWKNFDNTKKGNINAAHNEFEKSAESINHYQTEKESLEENYALQAATLWFLTAKNQLNNFKLPKKSKKNLNIFDKNRKLRDEPQEIEDHIKAESKWAWDTIALFRATNDNGENCYKQTYIYGPEEKYPPKFWLGNQFYDNQSYEKIRDTFFDNNNPAPKITIPCQLIVPTFVTKDQAKSETINCEAIYRAAMLQTDYQALGTIIREESKEISWYNKIFLNIGIGAFATPTELNAFALIKNAERNRTTIRQYAACYAKDLMDRKNRFINLLIPLFAGNDGQFYDNINTLANVQIKDAKRITTLQAKAMKFQIENPTRCQTIVEKLNQTLTKTNNMIQKADEFLNEAPGEMKELLEQQIKTVDEVIKEEKNKNESQQQSSQAIITQSIPSNNTIPHNSINNTNEIETKSENNEKLNAQSTQEQPKQKTDEEKLLEIIEKEKENGQQKDLTARFKKMYSQLIATGENDQKNGIKSFNLHFKLYNNLCDGKIQPANESGKAKEKLEQIFKNLYNEFNKLFGSYDYNTIKTKKYTNANKVRLAIAKKFNLQSKPKEKQNTPVIS